MKRVVKLLFGFSDAKEFYFVTITEKRSRLAREYLKLVDTIIGLLVCANIALAYFE